MKIWLDDVRDPAAHGRLGWEWAKSYDECIELLRKFLVSDIDLDHDLTPRATMGYHDGEKTGLEVLKWMNEYYPATSLWPRVTIHTASDEGRKRMTNFLTRRGIRFRVVLFESYGRDFAAKLTADAHKANVAERQRRRDA